MVIKVKMISSKEYDLDLNLNCIKLEEIKLDDRYVNGKVIKLDVVEDGDVDYLVATIECDELLIPDDNRLVSMGCKQV